MTYFITKTCQLCYHTFSSTDVQGRYFENPYFYFMAYFWVSYKILITFDNIKSSSRMKNKTFPYELLLKFYDYRRNKIIYRVQFNFLFFAKVGSRSLFVHESNTNISKMLQSEKFVADPNWKLKIIKNLFTFTKVNKKILYVTDFMI